MAFNKLYKKEADYQQSPPVTSAKTTSKFIVLSLINCDTQN